MGGSLPFPPALVYSFLALMLVPLPFLCAFAIRVVAGPRESIWTKGLLVFGLGLLCLVGFATAQKLRPFPVRLAASALSVGVPFLGFKSIAETTWLRAVAGVAISLVFYAVAIAGISLAFGWWRPHF